MSESTSAFKEFILKSVEMYLQTVLLIDDRIYESKGGSVAAPLARPTTGQRKSALKSAAAPSADKDDTPKIEKKEDKPEEVSFHDIQNSFAKKRIICSMYQPKRTASFGERSEVYSLCSAADVVIIDWDIYGDQGIKATELVGTLIQQSMKDIPHQLRLLLIYTLEVNLGAVANDIYENLKERLGEDAIIIEDGTEGLVLKTESARIVVLGKRDTGSLPKYSAFFVPENKLAERTIAEFSHLASGLLQGITLRGIAHLRENNRRILKRFNENLDPPFLAHRALLLPEDAFDQIIPLLTDELRAVLEDTIGEYPLGNESSIGSIITNWCDMHWRPDDNPRLNVGDGVDALEFAKDVFCNGQSMKDYSQARGSEIPGLIKRENEHAAWNEKKCLKLAEYLSCDDNHSDHIKLSSLLSQRIAYENTSRTLHLGVILRELKDNGRFLLCLQPVCDSVRINGKARTFIFCLLDEPDAEKPFTHAVIDLEGNPVQLAYKPKTANCYTTYFTTRTNAVSASKDAQGRFIFEDEGNNKYIWIAELKTLHAQRAAEDFGRTLSRVGLTESEWLRLKSKPFS